MAKAFPALIGIGNSVLAAVGLQTSSLAVLAGTGAAAVAASTYALSALAPQQTIKTESAKLTDSKITSSSEGEPVGLLFNKFRLGGNIIWATRIDETVQKTSSGGGKKSPAVETTNYVYTASFAVALCRGEVDSLDALYFDGTEVDLDTIDYTFYYGTDSQEPDPTIEVIEGVGNVPAYKNLCYIVFSNLELTSYGNRVPSISCEITRGGEYTLGQVVTEVCLEAGLKSSDIDTTDIDDISIGGYFRSDSSSFRDIIDSLLRIYKCEAVDTGGIIIFQKKNSAEEYTVNVDDLVISKDSPFGLTKVKRQKEDILSQVSYSYADPDKSYSVGTVITEKVDTVGVESEISTSIAISEVEARNSASLDLLEDRFALETVEFSLPMTYQNIDVGSYVTIGDETFKVSGKEESTVVKFAGTTMVKGVYENFEFDLGSSISEQNYEPTATTLYNLSLPLISGQTEEDFEHVVAAYQSPWFGSVDVYEPDGSGGYTAATSVPFPAVMGVTSTDLPEGATGVFDLKNTLTVTLFDSGDNLASISELSLLNGGNAAAVQTTSGEWEVLQFQEAVLNPDGSYTLSKLLRGQFGTEYYTKETTLSGAPFVILDFDRLQKLPTLLGDIGREVTFRYGPFSFDVTDDDLFTNLVYTPKSTAFRPYSPVHLKEEYSSGNINLSWIRRDRLNSDSWEQTEIPMSESVEAYEVDILDGSSVVRTLTTSSTSVTYTSAQQVSDFGSEQTTLDWRVYQMSASYGRGTPAIG